MNSSSNTSQLPLAQSSSFPRLLSLLLLKAFLLSLCMGILAIGLSPDEAQYWTWSQHLDWGYYSKPPGIAWQIWLTTSILGDTIFAIRFGGALIGFFIACSIYRLARFSGLSESICFWSAIVMAFSPLGFYLSSVATTDGGAILFLIGGITVVAKALFEEKSPNYYMVGLWILCGAIFKWTVYAFWPIALFSLLFFPKMRRWSLLGGILLSLVALVPTLYWNMSHEWATFKHVANHLGGKKGGNFFDFFSAQTALLSPIVFLFLVASYRYLFREKDSQKKHALLFCSFFPSVLLIYLSMAFFKKIQPNWAAYLYPPGALLVTWVACEHLKEGVRWLRWGMWLSVGMVSLAFFVVGIQSQTEFPIPYRINLFRQSVGWNHLSSALAEVGYDQNSHFLFGDKYQTTSLLSFYAKKRAYFFNLNKIRKNQFSFWPQMQEKEKGETGYFVLLENTEEVHLPWYERNVVEKLSPYFWRVECQGSYPLYSVGGSPVKYALIFKCTEYLGNAPENVVKY